MTSFKKRGNKIRKASQLKTVDESHIEYLDNLIKKDEEKKKINMRIISYKKKIIKEENKDKIKEYKKKIDLLNKKLDNFNFHYEILEYTSKTGDILIDYYNFNNDNDNEGLEKKYETNYLTSKSKRRKIKRRGIQIKEENKGKNIFDYYNIKEEKKENKNTLQEKYLFLVNKDFSCEKIRYNNPLICKNCNSEKVFLHMEGSYICKKCGLSEFIIIYNNINTNSENIIEKQKYPYKKINHLKEKLNQFQSRESALIPNEIYNIIINDLKRKRIEKNKCKRIDIKKILKDNKLTNYYENIQQIYCEVSGKPSITLSREVEDILINMFRDIQEPFKKHCPKTRSNFLSYSYVLNKLFRIIGYEEYSREFDLLKSKEKLKEQDIIWKKICIDMNWKFHPST